MLWLYLLAFAVLTAVLFYILLLPSLKGIDKQSQIILLLIATLVPVIGLVIYQQRGASDEVAIVEAMAALGQEGEDTFSKSLMTLQRDLEDFTDANPDEAEYWFILASMRMDMQDYEGAVEAYQAASNIVPEDVSLHSRLAEAQFLVDGYVLSAAVREHVDKVLASDPNDVTVLGILGISAYRAQQYEAAIQFWDRSLQSLPPFSAEAESIRSSIAQAQSALGIEPVSSEVAESASDTSGLSFDVAVSIDENIQYSASDVVFVFARQFNGPPMPVVVQRITAGDLPLSLRLDDSKVMIEGSKLADYEQLELVARLSFGGQPTAQAGDYEVVIGPVNPSEIAETVSLRIANIVE